MSAAKSFRRPTRNSDPGFSAYPRANVNPEPTPPLTADQIPLEDELDLLDASTQTEAAALGTDELALTRDIREEEHQRHPEANDDENAAGIAALAEAFHRRLGDRR